MKKRPTPAERKASMLAMAKLNSRLDHFFGRISDSEMRLHTARPEIALIHFQKEIQSSTLNLSKKIK